MARCRNFQSENHSPRRRRCRREKKTKSAVSWLTASGRAAERFGLRIESEGKPAAREQNLEHDRPHTPSPKEMKELIASLSPSERASLKDPNWITEDEADLILAERDAAEPGEDISFDDLLKENGMTRSNRRKHIA